MIIISLSPFKRRWDPPGSAKLTLYREEVLKLQPNRISRHYPWKKLRKTAANHRPA
jgi:hypothetical protein